MAILHDILAERFGSKLDDFEINVVSTVVCSAMEVVMRKWLESDGKADVMDLVHRALHVVEAGADVDGLAAGKPSMDRNRKGRRAAK